MSTVKYLGRILIIPLVFAGINALGYGITTLRYQNVDASKCSEIEERIEEINERGENSEIQSLYNVFFGYLGRKAALENVVERECDFKYQ